MLPRVTVTEAGSGPASPSGWMEPRFDECMTRNESNGQTHPHGWRDAPGAGLAVTEPGGTVVPSNRRVELQLMPLFLEGRRTGKDFSVALFTIGALVVVFALCLEGVCVC